MIQTIFSKPEKKVRFTKTTLSISQNLEGAEIPNFKAKLERSSSIFFTLSLFIANQNSSTHF
jgi:hypothetical protein